eukprot:jgi/Chlat1/643/Chrsp103S01052
MSRTTACARGTSASWLRSPSLHLSQNTRPVTVAYSAGLRGAGGGLGVGGRPTPATSNSSLSGAKGQA